MEIEKMDPVVFVQEYAIKSLVCCWSGGRSSLAMTHYVLSRLENMDVERYVVFVDTGVMLPDALSFIDSVASRFGWNLKVLKPKTDYWAYSARYGTPGIKRRWCCKILKLQPIFDFLKTLKPQRASALGFRADEKRKSRKVKPVVYYQRQTRSWVYLPIRNWTKGMVRQYIKEHGLPDPPWYKIGLKETCLCGAYTNRRELMKIKANYPELFQKFLDLDSQRRKWGRYAFWDHGPVQLQDLLKQKTLTDLTDGN